MFELGQHVAHKRRKPHNFFRYVISDILLAGIILVCFAFFHHVLPALKAGKQIPQSRPAAEAAVQMQTPAPVEENTAVQSESEPEPEPEPVETPDPRTPWQIQFAEHFTDEVVVTDNSYSSPNVSVTVSTVQAGTETAPVVYHVADIYVASLDYFGTYTAHNVMQYFDTQDAVEMFNEAGALLAINGDFITYQQAGFLMRNGILYYGQNTGCSICVLYSDGRMETYEPNTYDIDTVMAQGAVQVWNFGPVMLDAEGKAKGSYDASYTVAMINPRSAVGYYEPGHYCFVVVDGRQDGYSVGMTLPELGSLFESLGCTCAYNLDGGGSAVMLYNGGKYSQQSNGADRALGDILLVRDNIN